MSDYDAASLRFLAPLVGRVIDVRLAVTLQTNVGGDAGLPGLPPDRDIPTADRDKAKTVAQAWLAWYAALASEPGVDAAPWVNERMEYEFAVSAATPSGEVVLSAPKYVEGRLDWYSFAMRPVAAPSDATGETRNQDIRVTTIPEPLSYKRMPADRWWAFENGQIDFGAVGAGPADLVPLVPAEFALIYGNDWFVVPLEVSVGSLMRVRSLATSTRAGWMARAICGVAAASKRAEVKAAAACSSTAWPRPPTQFDSIRRATDECGGEERPAVG